MVCAGRGGGRVRSEVGYVAKCKYLLYTDLTNTFRVDLHCNF